MASTIPEQYRAVDPFGSYNSNTVNQITEIRSRAANVLDNRCGLDVVIDTTNTSAIIVLPGYVFKDDVMIRVTEEHSVDFDDPENYIYFDLTDYNNSVPGYFYIVLEYTYVKSRPAPQAKIKIIMDLQKGNYDYGESSTSLIFLKAVYISSTSPVTIDSLHDFDPDPGYEDNERTYAKRYVSPYTQLPAHDQCEHEGMVAYDTERSSYWLGTDSQWLRLAGKNVYQVTTWTADSGDYRHDISVADLSLDTNDVTLTCRDTSDDSIIMPAEIEILSTSTIRIWMPVNTVSMSVTII